MTPTAYSSPEIKLSFLLLAYNQPEMTAKRVAEYIRFVARANMGGECELIVIDNGSTPAIQVEHHKIRHCTVVRVEENQGFPRGFNEGLGHASGKYLALWSNDVSIGGNIASIVIQLMDSLQDIEPVILAKEVMSHSTGWNQFGNTIVPYPAGYFLCVRRKEWPGFDEIFTPYDYEDVDAGMWVKSEGGRAIASTMLPVEHLGAATIGFNEERREVTNRNRKKFADKWDLPLEPETL